MKIEPTDWAHIFKFKKDQGEVLHTHCTRCGTTLCKADDDWKRHVLVRETSFEELGCHIKDHPDMVAWEYFCPSCLTRFGVECQMRGERPNRDFSFETGN